MSSPSPRFHILLLLVICCFSAFLCLALAHVVGESQIDTTGVRARRQYYDQWGNYWSGGNTNWWNWGKK
ncbi:hypothetical protein niasHS_015709 [Heterodera schachtii]|uniref:Uncharacterized protein n=2 Tax=Heterodera TaxID=34509 RepID=A0ABD2I1U9_9BILA